MRTLTKDTPQSIGKIVTLIGWVHVRRDHGKLIFIDLRDRWGMVQAVFTPADPRLLKEADRLRSEWVVRIEGVVKERPKGMENPDLATGSIEIEAKKLQILAESKTPPFALDTDGREVGEEHRMKYRYLDLRRERMKRNLIMRDRLIAFIRDYLHKKDFIEIETPMLTKSTPEGARDYVVPSRLYPGKFYALPQSPQQYKQLLMVAGIEKYFQIARCLRDEDTRGDRQPEHTQLDMEMSYVSGEDVMSLVETMMTEMVHSLFPEKKFKTPWPRISYHAAMETYGSDKPDVRENKNDPNELAFAWVVDFPSFELDKETRAIQPVHHMFVQPQEGSVALIDTDPLKMVSTQYDWVCNGYELCSGSLRISDPELQLKVFKLLGMNEEKAQKDFGHMLEAFAYGAPPHGGIAPGLDRLLMLLLEEPNIREVIAFPKTGDGRDLMMDSPADISEAQLEELHLDLHRETERNK
ncbi:MAG: aspartate--tRNA ligase [Candidatus Sungbacteria bacterium]|uniref:Aspartate--tRNA(Asp/Asn) ligase n=1 Tax=Candidatus Sungiibacteriota bacterium TaxID=2750080 RepID=A0A932VPH2_9BACT|nr:aspartate--tRNA ligase [Candidatus Sungbacteria bacterium]